MCLSFDDEVAPRLADWGLWWADNRGSYANLGYSSDDGMSFEHLATAACGGGNKVETFDDMRGDVAFVDAMVSMLDLPYKRIADVMFVSRFDLREWSLKDRKGHAKRIITKKFNISERKFRDDLKCFTVAVCTVLDKPDVHEKHPYFQDICCNL